MKTKTSNKSAPKSKASKKAAVKAAKSSKKVAVKAVKKSPTPKVKLDANEKSVVARLRAFGSKQFPGRGWQKALGEALGFTRSHIANVANGYRAPSEDLIEALVKAEQKAKGAKAKAAKAAEQKAKKAAEAERVAKKRAAEKARREAKKAQAKTPAEVPPAAVIAGQAPVEGVGATA
jgi:transcriptional regulator with XRE-family HTH domain